MIAPLRRVALAVLLLGLKAFGAQPKLLIMPWANGEGVSQRAAARLEALVLDELRAKGDLEILPATTMAELVETGKRALEALRFEEAATAYRRSLEIVGADPNQAELTQLTEAQLGLATALFRRGEERAAKETLVALSCMAPGLRLPPSYPPVFRRELDRARQRAQRRPKGQLSVDGPKDARVSIDARELGRAPVLIDWPLVGPHLVRVDGPGGERFAQLVDVKPGLTKVHASFGAGGLALAEADLKHLGTLTRSAGARYALVGAVTRGPAAQLAAGLALYDAELDAVSALEPLTVEADEVEARRDVGATVGEILKRLAAFGPPATLPLSLVVRPRAPAPVRPAAPVLAPPPLGEQASRAPLLTQPPRAEVQAPNGPPTWVYVVAGVAVAAGLGVGGYFGITALTRPVTGTVSASW